MSMRPPSSLMLARTVPVDRSKVVSRSSDGGDYQAYKAPTTCNCYFDLIATGATSCKTCNTDADCSASAPN